MSEMKIDILTLFPDTVHAVLHESIIGRAAKKGEFFVQDILGFTVVDEQGNEVGKLVDAEETPAAMLYHVKGESEHLIPAVKEFILSIDAEKEEIRVHLIEGM